jgi:Spy/CpxP family protein refolding chaperone
MEILTDTFSLTKDQERAIKALMNDAEKSATPVREALAGARPAIVAAVQGGKAQPEIDAVVLAYATQATAMTALEMQALAQVMQTLTPAQRANQSGVRATFYLMRGAFIGKHWDDVPNPDKGY